jgi:hypothetical protein
MAQVAGIFRTVIIPYGSEGGIFDEAGFMANPFFSTLMANALAQGVRTSYVSFYTYPGGVPTPGHGFQLDFAVNAAGDAAIVAALPSLTGAVSWSTPITYGF